VTPAVIPGGPDARENASLRAKREFRSPLAQLLHGLNQPLTGLQCAMEVALARPRTLEEYVEGLRQGLELTERMRALVGAIREVVDEEERDVKDKDEATELNPLLREVVDELQPVAEAKNLRITLDCPAAWSWKVKGGRRRASTLVFRLLESAASLAAPETVLEIETGGAAPGARMRICWRAAKPRAEFSPPELGLLVAQAGWERAGAEWERRREDDAETVTIRRRGVGAGGCFKSGDLK
jgi:signal transduction histidine kinase